MYKIAIVYICIGEYIKFFERSYTSFETYFCNKSHVEYFVFTEAAKMPIDVDDARVHIVHQEDLGWPGNTLYRYKMFLRKEEELRSFDYCFFFNSNMVCMTEIKEEEFLPIEEELLVLRHPCYYDVQNPEKLPYERDKKSTAAIPKHSKIGKEYYIGALNGGKTDAFLDMCNELNRRIDIDKNRGVVARWHDESHMNRYIAERSDYKILDPSYGNPEDFDIPFETKICILEKKRYIKLSADKVGGAMYDRFGKAYLIDKYRHLKREATSYLIVGILTTIVSLAVYYGLVLTLLDPHIALQMQTANILSWIAAVSFAYLTNRKYVFKSKNPNVLKEANAFFAARISTLLIDMLAMFIMVSAIGISDKIAKLIVQVIVFVSNYLLSKFLVFRKGGKNA